MQMLFYEYCNFVRITKLWSVNMNIHVLIELHQLYKSVLSTIIRPNDFDLHRCFLKNMNRRILMMWSFS